MAGHSSRALIGPFAHRLLDVDLPGLTPAQQDNVIDFTLSPAGQDIVKKQELAAIGKQVAAATTKDGKVTLKTAECLASCGTAPMIQVDKEYFEDLTPEKVDAILGRLTS